MYRNDVRRASRQLRVKILDRDGQTLVELQLECQHLLFSTTDGFALLNAARSLPAHRVEIDTDGAAPEDISDRELRDLWDLARLATNQGLTSICFRHHAVGLVTELTLRQLR